MPVDYVKIARENEPLVPGIDRFGRDLLAHRYSDPTHFVYELLQNAEDALKERLDSTAHSTLPRAAKFILFKDRLEFRHFGIPFAEKHVRAICDIARSSKQTTSGAIGHFGIGFKSVYRFTRSPEVHSCGESFVIESLVRPAAVAEKQTAKGETLFVLPFNHAEQTSSESHRIIAERLRELGLRTLLFLRHLDGVDWEIEGGGFGRYLRESKKVAEGVEHITLVGEERGKPTMEEHWLVFSRAVSGESGASELVKIAYQLQQTKGKRRDQIRRTKASPLCVYFATKLDTRLGFLVQGPFHLTPSRETIRENDKWNDALAKEVGKLTADSLSKLKALGLLSVSALDAMPLERGEPFETETGKLFLPVYDAVLQALKKQPLIPSVDKRFVKGAAGVLVRGRELTDLFSRDQLQILFGNDREWDWITPEITENGSTKKLHDYLYGSNCVDARVLGADDLPDRLDEEFLHAQDENWFARFYRFLLKKHESLWSEGGGLRDRPIIRLADGSNVAPFDSDRAANAFLPTTDGENDPTKTVHPKLAKGHALTFLKQLGIEERDSVSEVLADILPQYQSGEAPAERKHERNLSRIFRALEQKESSSHSKLVKELREIAFLQATNAKTGKREFQSPASLLYFKSSELSEYFEDQDDCWFLAEPSITKKAHVWLAELGVGELPALTETPDEVTARREREIAPDEPRKREVECTDYHLHGLESVFKRVRKLCKAHPKQAVKLSRIAWGILARVAGHDDGRYLRGTIKWKRPSARRVEEDAFDSHFVERLREETWLPDRKGKFHKPSEMQEQDLPASFERNRKFCEAMQFRTPRAEWLKQAGVPIEDIRWLEIKERNPEAAAEFIRQCKKRSALPEAATAEQKTIVTPVTMDGMSSPESSKVPSGRPESTPIKEPETAGVPTAATAQTCSEVVGADATTVDQNGDRSPRTDHLQTRVRVVAGTESESTPKSQEMAEFRSRIDQAGIVAVKAFEKQAGRSVTEMPHNHPGYDLESWIQSGEVLRFIEVKSTGADWNGVLLSATQFRKAQELGGRYWLYVVENADSPTPNVFPIQNPAGLSEKFIFDAGWKDISSSQQHRVCSS